jgi:hypothetical protein
LKDTWNYWVFSLSGSTNFNGEQSSRYKYLYGSFSANRVTPSLRYREETIYDKSREGLWGENISATLELKEKWGTISNAFEASHYFKDFSKNRLQLYSELSLRLFKGLSLSLYGNYSRIHDQISLPKGEATLDQVLLRRTQLATSYSYYGSIGLSYTFGSMFSKVVNPRFGN